MKELGVIKGEPTKENGLIPVELGDGTRVLARWLSNSQPNVNMAVTVLKTSTGTYVVFTKNAPIGSSQGKKSQQTKPRYDWDVDYPNGEVWNEPIKKKKKIKAGVVALFVCPYSTLPPKYNFALFDGESFLFIKEPNNSYNNGIPWSGLHLSGELFVEQTENQDLVVCHISDYERIPWVRNGRLRGNYTFFPPPPFEIDYFYFDSQSIVQKKYNSLIDFDVNPFYLGEGVIIANSGEWEESDDDDLILCKPTADFKLKYPSVAGWGEDVTWYGWVPAATQTNSCCFPVFQTNLKTLIPSIDKVTHTVEELTEEIKQVEGSEEGKHYILSNGVDGIEIRYDYTEKNSPNPLDYPLSFKFRSQLFYKSVAVNQKPSFSYGHNEFYKEVVEYGWKYGGGSDSRIDDLVVFPMNSLWPRKRGWYPNYYQKPMGGLQIASLINGKVVYDDATGVITSEKLEEDENNGETVNLLSLDTIFVGSTVVYAYTEDNKIYQILGVVDGYNYYEESNPQFNRLALNIELDKSSKKEVPYDYYLANCKGNATLYSLNSSIWDVFRSDYVMNMSIKREDWVNSVIYADYDYGNYITNIGYTKLSDTFPLLRPDRGTNRSISWIGDSFYISHLPKPYLKKEDCPDTLKIMAEVYKFELNSGLYELVRQNDIFEAEIPMTDLKESDIWDTETPVIIQSISLPKNL